MRYCRYVAGGTYGGWMRYCEGGSEAGWGRCWSVISLDFRFGVMGMFWEEGNWGRWLYGSIVGRCVSEFGVASEGLISMRRVVGGCVKV